MNCTPLTPPRSRNFQKSEESTLVLRLSSGMDGWEFIGFWYIWGCGFGFTLCLIC